MITEDMIEKMLAKGAAFGVKFLICLVILFVGSRLIKLVRNITKKSLLRANAEQGVMSFVDSFIKASLFLLLLFFILSYLGVNTASVIALLGSAGVAIGLAVQGSLSNLAGGVLILLLKPFRVGDYIREDTHGNEGTVSEIQIFYTKLLTVDNRTVILPNGTLANTSLTNISGNHYRMADIKVGISYQADIKKAKAIMQRLMDQDPAVCQDKPKKTFVAELADSSVDLKLRCWFKQEDYWEGYWRLNEEVKLSFDEEGIEIPFNQLDVHVK